MSKLLDYLNTLDKDAPAREAFSKEPRAAITQHGLNEAEQAAFLFWDKAAIAKLIGIDAAEFPMIQVLQNIYRPN